MKRLNDEKMTYEGWIYIKIFLTNKNRKSELACDNIHRSA